MSYYKDKVAVVTGAASGIGRCLTKQLLLAGASVCLCDISADALARTETELATSTVRHKQIATFVLDVAKREQFAPLVSFVEDTLGPIDFLFNNAGIGVGGEAVDFSPGDWDRVIQVNLFGVIHGVEAVYPKMVARGTGHIVNVSSVAGLVPLAGEISYTTSKYAVVGLTHTLRAEAADLGVRVSLVCPGKIETPIYETSRIIGFDRDKVLSLWPKGVTPEECARVILEGVAENRATIVVTRLAKAMWWLQRISPPTMIWAARRYMKKMRAFRQSTNQNDAPVSTQ